ncbi:NusA N-terminal domain-containing protein [Mycoplasma sp. 744]|uniref:NusA N-terminal domain-containing protein n=1 Tax=Mycoplasma sp. 744 TaxID=3108531 RepID=UPI002B1E0E61|nr:NusA N-terminal domain-containing protein [Mycoplasma sp. 744]MEA4115230.1 NusA N-terminal domain-containing protein [Mycoplasma sp. 744]
MALKTDSKHLAQEKQFYKVITEYSLNHNLPLDKIVEVFNAETTKIIRKKLDQDADMVFELDKKNKVAKLYNLNVTVVEDDEDTLKDLNENPETRIYNIPLNEAKIYNPNIQVNDLIKAPIDFSWLTNSKDTNIKQILKIIFLSIIQGIKLLEKRTVFEKYSMLVGTKVIAEFVTKTDKGHWNVVIKDQQGLNVTGFLPKSIMSEKKNIKRGEKIEVIVEKVEEDAKLNQIIVSLDSPIIVKKVLNESIPEINEGLIEIYKIQRQPGERTKIALKKSTNTNLDFDLHGAIIGIQSQRINSLRSKLEDERIDIIEYSDDIKTFIINALSPAQIVDVVKKNNDENNKNYYVIVKNEHLTNAIGKKGVNASLASAITNTFLDIITIEKAEELNLIYNKSTLETFNSPKNKINKKNVNNKLKNNKYINNFNLTMDTFDKDVAAFELEEEHDNKYYDLNFEELFEQHSAEMSIQDNNDEEVQKEIIAEEIKEDLKNFKKAKKVIEEFKIDTDLTNFGLDTDIDLSDLENEDW